MVKKCKRCEKEFPLTKEYWYWNKPKDVPNWSHCKTCHKHRNKNYPSNQSKERRRKHVRLTYKITLEEYERYLEKPCGICGKESEHLDHNHETGEIRGGLCSNCNRGLGHFQDSMELLERGIKWLKEKGTYSTLKQTDS